MYIIMLRNLICILKEKNVFITVVEDVNLAKVCRDDVG